MAQKQMQKTAQKQRHEDELSAVPQEPVNDEELSGLTDEMLDEIDSVLEENAAEFVNGFIQTGGQ